MDAPLMSKENPAEETNRPSPFIVAIGASTGGLETLKTFFTHSTQNTNIAFIIITHPSSDHKSIFPELLQQYTPIKVLPISNNQKIEANHIYVLPPSRNVAIHHGVLELIEKKSNADAKLPIDFFLCSLAKEKGRKVICVILSGMGNNGTIGLRSLREQGSIIIAQTAKSARYDGMPKNAINTGLVDYTLLPEDMYTFILKYTTHFNDKQIFIEDSISRELEQILELLKSHTSHDFSLYKPNTILRRIQKRINNLQMDNLSAYVYYLHQQPAEINILFKELFINVTNFFRDPEAFDTLKKVIVEKILSTTTSDKCIRVWVPGCSSGEEAYSLAILIHECMEALNIHLNVQIFGTDIDEDAIEIARAGVFPLTIKKDVSPARLERYFIKEENAYKVKTDLRKMIIFAVQNIIKDPPFTKLHLLSCRNLLIYFKSQLQKKIFPLFHYSLNPHGLLFLGTSENIGSSVNFFNIIDKRLKIYERKNGGSTFHSALGMAPKNPLSEITGVKMTEKNMHEVEPSLSNLVKSILLRNYTPVCVVIDEKENIVFIYGRTSRFLELASGEVRLQFMDMIRSELKSKIHIAIHKALAQQKEIILNGLQFKELGEYKYVNVKIRPIHETGAVKRNLLLIVFEENTPFERSTVNEKPTINEGFAKQTTQLEQELKYTKKSLQTTIEELETTNEELKSSIEELQSTNEELQSTNEEIETSKEELTLVNAELESRIGQLSSANDDIKNLLDNTDIATIFLDRELCIRRFTPKATKIINLISTDVGRPINHIVSNLQYDKLVEDAKNVLSTLEPMATEGIDKNGRWYAIHIIPYRTITNLVDGVVVTFLNIHAQKVAENKIDVLENNLVLLKEFNHTLLNSISHPAILLDKKLNVLLANYSFSKEFNVKNEELMGCSIYKIKIEWDKTGLKNLIDQLLQEDSLVKTAKITISREKQAITTAFKLSTSTILLTLN